LSTSPTTSVFKEASVETFIYANLAVTTLFGQYFTSMGFSPLQIGILMAVIPVSSLVSNPFWFRLRLQWPRRKAISWIALGTASLVWTVFLLPGFPGKLVGTVLLGFFLAALVPIGEANVIESLTKKKRTLDIPRLWGTIGFSASSLFLGLLIKLSFAILFAWSTLCALMGLMLIFRLEGLPSRVEEHDEKSPGAGPTPKRLWFYLGFAGLSISLVAFGNAFLPVVVRERGYDISLTGISFAVLSVAEIPFLFFARKIIKLFGVTLLAASGVFLLAVRITLTPFMLTPLSFVLIQLVHGWNFIVIYYSLTTYIHFFLPKNRISHAQASFWMVFQGISYIVGSVVGGIVVNYFGLQTGYVAFGCFGFALSVPLFFVAIREKKKLVPA